MRVAKKGRLYERNQYVCGFPYSAVRYSAAAQESRPETNESPHTERKGCVRPGLITSRLKARCMECGEYLTGVVYSAVQK
jgi:hypothetical protein